MRVFCALALVVGVAVPLGQVLAAEDAAKNPASYDRTEPLWELGLGGAVANLPHYPAAAQNQTRFLPFPFLSIGAESFVRTRKASCVGAS